MQMEYRRVRSARGTQHLEADGRMRCLHLSGRAAGIAVAPATAMLWICLRGDLTIESADGPFRLDSRRFVYLGTAAVKGVARGSGEWLAVALPQPEVSRITRACSGGYLPEPAIFPTPTPLTRRMLATLATLLRQRDAADSIAASGLIDPVLHAVIEAQAPTREWLTRAPGRSERHRRQAVFRLLSARNRILNQPFEDHDLDTLAAAARYSKSHFLRSFRAVFGLTPHELLAESRVRLAKALIDGSDLAVHEIAVSVGYDSGNSFARMFKKRVGTTVSGFRKDSADMCRNAA